MSLHNPAQAAVISGMPPSDFKDLIQAAVHLRTDTVCFLRDINRFPGPHNNNSPQPSDEQGMTECQMTTARVLVNRHDDLSRNYGWALAGDRACVDQALRGICEAERGPSDWFKELVRELEDLRLVLEGLQSAIFENDAGTSTSKWS